MGFSRQEHWSGLSFPSPINTTNAITRDNAGKMRMSANFHISICQPLFTRGRRKWQPTPVFLPGESQGQRGLVGGRLWGCTESDMTEAT